MTHTATTEFARRVIDWQSREGRRDLPWQGTRDAYRVWLSEIMLQQTQVATVLPYYARFVAAFPDVAALAAAPRHRVLELWSGLGYYRRAHHLHAAAQVVVAQHGGSFPEGTDALAALPGVGRSTAAAIAVFAFGARAAILDGNVKRVLARHRAIDGYPGTARVAARLWSLAETLVPATGVATYTQGMMDLGATVCIRSNPRCGDCPVRDDCIARNHDRIHELPMPRPKRTLPHREMRVLIVEHAGEILFEKRPPVGVWAGLVSLPELPIDSDVARELLASYGGHAELGAALSPLTHGFTHFTLTLHPQRVALSRRPAGAESPSRVWLTREDARGAALPAPIRRLLRDL